MRARSAAWVVAVLGLLLAGCSKEGESKQAAGSAGKQSGGKAAKARKGGDENVAEAFERLSGAKAKAQEGEEGEATEGDEPFKRKTPPEVATVVRQSREFLELLGRKDYATAAERFLKADAKRLGEVKGKLRQICRPERVRLDDLRSQQFRSHEEVRKYLDNQPSPPEHADYVARLLYAIISQPEPNPWMSPNRTERFLAWYLGLAFSQADAANATLASEDPERGEGLLTVRIAYPAPAPPAVEGMPDPTMLRWRLMGNDWVLEFGTDDHLDEVLRFLRGLTPK